MATGTIPFADILHGIDARVAGFTLARRFHSKEIKR
jgi:hypothetical protein